MAIDERVMVTIEVDPESELARALAAMDEKAVVLVSNGARFSVMRAEDGDPSAGSDQERVREALRAGSGIFTPEEAERLKQDIYRWREEGTRPIDRP
jgi:hypothetical protein